MPFPLIPLAIMAAGKYLQHRAKNKAAKEANKAGERQRKATVSGLNIKNQMGEDTRTARLKLAQSLLGSVPAGPRGENRGTALDPALVEQLGIRRNYDFDSAVAQGEQAGAGAGSAFLGGLLGDVGSAALGAGVGNVGGSDPGEVGGFGGTSFEPSLLPMGQPLNDQGRLYDPDKDYKI